MNCTEFETVLADLATNRPLPTPLKQGGLDHRDSCRRCRERYEDEVKLTAGLRAVAVAALSEGAPPRIEAALIEAFRDRHLGPAAPVVAAAAWRWGWKGPALAAAAVILVALAAPRLYHWLSSGRPPALEVQQPAPPDQALPEKSTPPAGRDTGHYLGKNGTQEVPRRLAGTSDATRRAGSNRGGAVSTQRDSGEIATDFIPVGYSGETVRLEGSQVIRVALPRSTLVSFGLPMNPDRANEPIRADVLLGDDGLARAIRFVR